MKGLRQNYGSLCSDFTAEFPDYSPRSGLIVNQSGGSNPASAFYATEVYMGLPQCDFQANSSVQFKNSYNQFENGGIFGDSQPGIEPYLGSSNISPSVANNQSSEVQYIRPEGSYANSFINFSETGSEQLLRLKRKLLGDVDDSNKRSPFDSFTKTQDLHVSQNLYATHLDHVKQFGRPPSITSSNNSAVSSNKTRIRWTQDLHDRFIECVNQLGGPEKATPKAILKLMNNEGLTIFHIKSHLQKYRNAKYVPEPVEGKSEKISTITPIDPKTGMQLKDALQLQLDVQRSLHEQLEIQKKLQLRIEEQGRQLRMMFDQQQKTTQSLMEPKNSNNNRPDNLGNPEIFVLEDSDDDGDVNFPSKIKLGAAREKQLFVTIPS